MTVLPPTPPTPSPDDVWELDTTHIGRRVEVYREVDSTNTAAAALAGDVSRHGLVILAESQRAGRGQFGRTWACAPRRGVLMSVLLFVPPPLRRPVILTSWAAVAVCDAVHELTGLDARIKWPNDVLVRGRKISGILIEQGPATVAGVGLNVSQTEAEFEAAGLSEATSLAAAGTPTVEAAVPRPPDWAAAARALITHLDRGYDALASGRLSALERSWKQRLGLVGRNVVLDGTEGNCRGRLVDVGYDTVAIETAETVVRLRPEAVRHVHAV